MARLIKRKCKQYQVSEEKEYQLVETGEHIFKIEDVSYDRDDDVFRITYLLDDERKYYGKYRCTNPDGSDNSYIISLLEDIYQASLDLQYKPNAIDYDMLRSCIGHYILAEIIHKVYKGKTYDLFKKDGIYYARDFDYDPYSDESDVTAEADVTTSEEN